MLFENHHWSIGGLWLEGFQPAVVVMVVGTFLQGRRRGKAIIIGPGSYRG
jgi:hypothetical protein